MKKVVALMCVVACAGVARAAYRIEATVQGLADSTVYLSRYHGSHRELLDSSRFDARAYVVFTSTTNTLSGGLYMLFAAGHEVEFLVSGEADFTLALTAQMPHLEQSVDYQQSPLNIGFKRFVALRNEHIGQQQYLRQRYQNYQNNADSMAAMQRLSTLAQQRVQAEAKRLMQEYKGSTLATLIRATIEPEKPFFVTAEPEKYFFDNIDFSSESTVYMPLLEHRLSQFFGQVVSRKPTDAIIAQLDAVLGKASANKLVYRETLMWLYKRYKEAGAEGEYLIALHLCELMSTSPAVDWLTPKERSDVERNAKILALNPVGTEATNLVLQTPDGESVSLHGVKATVTVLMFFNPDCGSCRKQTPIVHEQYLRYKSRGITVYAVYPDRNASDWKRYIADNKYDDWINVWDAEGTANIYERYSLHAIPQIYVLDKNKKIRYKDIDARELDGILAKMINN